MLKLIQNTKRKATEMSTIAPPQNPEANPRVKAVFDDIRATRGSDFINNLWHYLAFDESLLENTWRDVKAVMATPSKLDPMTKELIYAAVSIACLLYTSPSPRDLYRSRMPSSA